MLPQNPSIFPKKAKMVLKISISIDGIVRWWGKISSTSAAVTCQVSASRAQKLARVLVTTWSIAGIFFRFFKEKLSAAERLKVGGDAPPGPDSSALQTE